MKFENPQSISELKYNDRKFKNSTDIFKGVILDIKRKKKGHKTCTRKLCILSKIQSVSS